MLLRLLDKYRKLLAAADKNREKLKRELRQALER